MHLQLFNPTHDEALAAFSPFYYPTTTARDLALRWAALPALWAGRGDAVLLPDGAGVPPRGKWCEGVTFVGERELTPALCSRLTAVEPWGWDPLVCRRLRRLHIPERLLPTDEHLNGVRCLSSRRTTAAVLPPLLRKLRREGLCQLADARSFIADGLNEAERTVEQWKEAMAKPLWSCSGRGIFRVSAPLTEHNRLRLRRHIIDQGAVELEPVFAPRFNFALELEALPSGQVRTLGWSVFEASAAGAYGGNGVAEQQQIASLIGRHGEFSGDALQTVAEVCRAVMEDFLGGCYVGPLGIDMMWVDDAASPGGTPLLHPCVEVNVRRTMGHVALVLARRELKKENLPEFVKDLFYFCSPCTNVKLEKDIN